MTNGDGSGSVVTRERLLALRDQAKGDLPRAASQSETALRSGRRQGSGGDIFDLRPYQDGDDPRHVDAAASARSGRIQIRRRHEEVGRTVLLVADFRTPMLWGTRGRLRSVAAAEELALIGWQAVAAQGRVGCLVARDAEAEPLVPQPREQAMLAVADTLVRCHAAAMAATSGQIAPLSAVFVQAAAMLKPGSTVILATGMDQPGADFVAAAEALMCKCQLEIILVQDTVQISPPPGVFSVRTGTQIARARFGVSPVPDLLKKLSVTPSVIDASAKAGMSA